MRKKLFCYHVTTQGRYEFITDQVIRLAKPYLDECDKIMICVNDVSNQIDKIDLIMKKHDISTYELYDNGGNDWEFVTLCRLHEFIIDNNDQWNILYVHSKGVNIHGSMAYENGSDYNQCIEDWREYMLYFVVEKYKDCLDLLATGLYDGVGVDLRSRPHLHFSGNFWWATSDYIKTLCSPRDVRINIASERHKCEFWIGSGNGRLRSLHDCGIDCGQRHLQLYPRNKYTCDDDN